MAETHPPTPECPRCGYDLSGQQQSWAEACPLHGICSECGLELDFASILDEAQARKWRFFEVAERRLFNALVVTTRRALRPPRFWTWVRMEHRMSHRRAWAGAFMGMVGLYIAAAVASAIVLAALDYLPQLLGAVQNWWWRRSFLDHLGSRLFASINPLDQLEYGSWLGGMMTHSFIVLLTLVLTPFGFLCLPLTLRAAKVRKRHLVRITAWSMITPPLLLLLLTFTLNLFEAIEVWVSQYAAGRVSYFESRFQGRIFAAIAIIWLTLWWFFACRDYLKLPRSAAIACAMITIALLLAVLLTLLIPGAAVPLTT